MGDARRLRQRELTLIQPKLSHKAGKKAGLATAIAADDADLLTIMNCKAGILEENLFAAHQRGIGQGDHRYSSVEEIARHNTIHAMALHSLCDDLSRRHCSPGSLIDFPGLNSYTQITCSGTLVCWAMRAEQYETDTVD